MMYLLQVMGYAWKPGTFKLHQAGFAKAIAITVGMAPS